MSVPPRATEPARPHIAPDTLVDFHTGERVLENDDLRVQLCVSWRHNPELVYDIEEDTLIQSWTDAQEEQPPNVLHVPNPTSSSITRSMFGEPLASLFKDSFSG